MRCSGWIGSAAGLTLLATGQAASTRKSVVIDTDLFSDCDDAAALLLAATSPAVDLLAVNVNYRSSFSALAASAILAHYGRAGVPVGAARPLTNETFIDTFSYELGEYASKVAYHWSGGVLPWGQAAQAWEPVSLYRKVLSEARDGSVTIVSIGFLDNLSGLLNSTADTYSDLSGSQLIKSKVAELVVMGGQYPSGREFNFWGGNASLAAHVVSSWDGPIVYSGFEMGIAVLTGKPLMDAGPADDPVRAAYTYYTYGHPRFSWDPLTMLYAIEGLSDYFEFGNENGRNHVEADGSNQWSWDEATTNQHWLRLKVDNVTIADKLDRLFLGGAWSVQQGRPPGHTLQAPHLTHRPREEL